MLSQTLLYTKTVDMFAFSSRGNQLALTPQDKAISQENQIVSHTDQRFNNLNEQMKNSKVDYPTFWLSLWCGSTSRLVRTAKHVYLRKIA